MSEHSPEDVPSNATPAQPDAPQPETASLSASSIKRAARL